MGAVLSMSERTYNPAQIKLIKDMFVKGASDDQFNLFVEVCRSTGLDPFRREIYGIIREVYNKDTKSKEPQLTIVVGIDGFRRRSDETGTYMPDDKPPVIEFDPDAVSDLNPKGIVSCTVTLKKFHAPSNMWMPVPATVYWDEYVPTKTIWEDKKPTDKKEIGNPKWRESPVVMISKCAEAAAHRKGWPAVHAGLYEPTEMDAASMSATDVLDVEAREKREVATRSRDSITFQFGAGTPLEHIEIGKVHDRVDAWIKDNGDREAIKEFAQTNKESLRAFWAKDPDAALSLKASMEAAMDTDKTAIGNG